MRIAGSPCERPDDWTCIVEIPTNAGARVGPGPEAIRHCDAISEPVGSLEAEIVRGLDGLAEIAHAPRLSEDPNEGAQIRDNAYLSTERLLIDSSGRRGGPDSTQ